MGKKSGVVHKKLKILKAEISTIHSVLKKYTKVLENVCQRVASSKELNKEVCMELGKKCLKSEEKAVDMEDYYNRRIEYYKKAYALSCKECIVKNSEVVDVYKKYVVSLEEIDKLKGEIEEANLKKKLYQSRIIDRKSQARKE